MQACLRIRLMLETFLGGTTIYYVAQVKHLPITSMLFLILKLYWGIGTHAVF